MEKSLIGKMIKKIKLNLKSAKNNATKTVALALVLGAITTSTTGCFFNFNNKKDVDNSITPDDLVTDVATPDDKVEEGPVAGDADKEEKPLKSDIPSLDFDNDEPDVGVVDEPQTDEIISNADKDEVELSPETEKQETETSVNTDQANKIIKTLKSAINSELKEYFKETKTTDDAKYSVSDIIFVEANNRGIEIGFTTDAGKNGGYSVITVGGASDSEDVNTLIGGLTSKAYLATMNASALEDLVAICSEAVEDSGISKNIESYYLIPVTADVSDLGNLVVAYYKSFNPNSENCKKVKDGYKYSANVLIQDANGMKSKTVSETSTARLGRNQYFDLINDAIEDQLTNKNENELGL